MGQGKKGKAKEQTHLRVLMAWEISIWFGKGKGGKRDISIWEISICGKGKGWKRESMVALAPLAPSLLREKARKGHLTGMVQVSVEDKEVKAMKELRD